MERDLANQHKEFVKLLISGGRSRCSEYAHDYFKQANSVKALYEDVLKSSLYEIGKLWEYNKISVATEHLASAIVEAILNEFYHNIATKRKTEKTVILSCVEEEQHQIGVKMISDIFEMNGWNSYFLGANTPTKELIDYTKLVKPDLLAVSLSIYFHLPVLEEMLQKVREEFPGQPVLVGGQAFSRGGEEVLQKYKNIYYKPDLMSVESFIKNFNSYG
ncbi:MAG: cobalamin B12-binding domain-containing protein [Bacteroidota bacterium]